MYSPVIEIIHGFRVVFSLYKAKYCFLSHYTTLHSLSYHFIRFSRFWGLLECKAKFSTETLLAFPSIGIVHPHGAHTTPSSLEKSPYWILHRRPQEPSWIVPSSPHFRNPHIQASQLWKILTTAKAIQQSHHSFIPTLAKAKARTSCTA